MSPAPVVAHEEILEVPVAPAEAAKAPLGFPLKGLHEEPESNGGLIGVESEHLPSHKCFFYPFPWLPPFSVKFSSVLWTLCCGASL